MHKKLTADDIQKLADCIAARIYLDRISVGDYTATNLRKIVRDEIVDVLIAECRRACVDEIEDYERQLAKLI